MTMFAGLDVGFKRTAVCVVDRAGRSVWRGVVDTHPEAIAAALRRWRNELEKVGLETGSMSPWLARGLGALGFPVVCMDARRAADAVKSRRVKSDKADAFALAEMLRTGWYSAVHVKSEESHRLKALLGARDQLVRAKRALGNQVRGLLRPFGIRLPSRQGTKKFADAAYQAVAHDAMLCASVTALMEALAAIQELGTQAHQAAWTEAGARGGGAQARRGARPDLEGRHAFRGRIEEERGLPRKRQKASERSSIPTLPATDEVGPDGQARDILVAADLSDCV